MKIGTDKILHAVVCFFATAVVGCACFWLGEAGSILCGVFFALGLGIGKEYGDSKASGNKWDWFDILADVVGIVVAVIALVVVYKVFK